MNMKFANLSRQAAIRRHQHGVGLVELMVSLVIGLFLVAVMSAIYLGAKNTFTAQESLSRIQEGARYAAEKMTEDLREAGFRTCAGMKNGLIPFRNTLNSSGDTSYDFGRGISVSRYSGGAWTPSLDAAITALNPSNTSDVLTIYKPASNSWGLIADMAMSAFPLDISATPDIKQGDIMMIGDCTGASVFQATNVDPGPTARIEHFAVPGPTPGNSTPDLGQIYQQDSNIYRVQAVTYYVAPSTLIPGASALWVRKNPAYEDSAVTELVTGIERLAVTLGVDSNNDMVVDRYLAPASVGSLTVLNARFEMVVASTEDATATSPQPYKFGGATITPTDRRLRTVVTMVTSLRNTLP